MRGSSPCMSPMIRRRRGWLAGSRLSVLGREGCRMSVRGERARLPCSSAGLVGWFGRRRRGRPSSLGGGVLFRRR